MLVVGENLDDRGWVRLQRGLDAGDRWGEVGAALLDRNCCAPCSPPSTSTMRAGG